MKIRSEDEIRESLFAAVTTRTGCSDVNEAGVLAQLIPEFAVELGRAHLETVRVRDTFYRRLAKGTDADARGREVLPSGLTREGAKFAVGGAFVFSRGTPAADLVTIPVGTPVVRSADGFRGTTLVECTIAIGDTQSTPAVPVVAARRGAIGNCWANDYDTLGGTLAGVESVTNTAAIQNGTDREDDDEYVQRQVDYVKSFGRVTRQALVNAALEVNDPTWGRVTHAAVSTPTEATRGIATLWIDNGTGLCDVPVEVASGEVLLDEAAGGERYLYLSGRPVATPPIIYATPSGGAPAAVAYTLAKSWGQVRLAAAAVAGDHFEAGAYYAYAGLVRAVQDKINGPVLDPAGGVCYIAAGDIVQVAPASLYGGGHLDVAISLVLKAGIAYPDDELARIRAAVVATINGSGIAQGMYRAAIKTLCMGMGTVLNVTRVLFNGVDEDIHGGAGQVIRTTDSNVEVQ